MIEERGLEASHAASALPNSGKRKRDESSADSSVVAEGELRFEVGQRVLCNVSKRSRGFLWKPGTISARSHEVEGSIVPYIVELDDGKLAASPEDDDECIRLAARASLDTRVMRVFAVLEAKQGAVSLRFMEGDRVAVQLDIGIWEEGVVIEVWAVPESNGKPWRTWVGVAVPYAVRLDLGGEVMVPFDSDEVIRAEAAARPPQKSVEEQLGGKVRRTSVKRFDRRQSAFGQWVIVDTVTGFERPCKPPDSH